MGEQNQNNDFMKTTLPKRSLVIKERLDEITKEILATLNNKVVMIILFGSYARGDWVHDEYREGNVIYIYQSDLDIMVIVKKKYSNISRIRMESEIENRLKKKGLLGARYVIEEQPSVSLVIESIADVNKHLGDNRYFFADVKKEGVVLYNSGEYELAEPKDLPWKERREIAKQEYDLWFKGGLEFLKAAHFSLSEEALNNSAFQLHQATEHFFNAILLVFANYKYKGHDIKKLGARASNYNADLLTIFPCATKEQEEMFELLRDAYIKARYDRNYKITREQLLYLIERVEKLQNLTKKICLEYIDRTS
jgi:HEPN domain-containing protein/predicted nucleotidyltransferase